MRWKTDVCKKNEQIQTSYQCLQCFVIALRHLWSWRCSFSRTKDQQYTPSHINTLCRQYRATREGEKFGLTTSMRTYFKLRVWYVIQWDHQTWSSGRKYTTIGLIWHIHTVVNLVFLGDLHVVNAITVIDMTLYCTPGQYFWLNTCVTSPCAMRRSALKSLLALHYS